MRGSTIKLVLGSPPFLGLRTPLSHQSPAQKSLLSYNKLRFSQILWKSMQITVLYCVTVQNSNRVLHPLLPNTLLAANTRALVLFGLELSPTS